MMIYVCVLVSWPVEFCVTFVLVLHIARTGLLLIFFRTQDVLRDKTRKKMVV